MCLPATTYNLYICREVTYLSELFMPVKMDRYTIGYNYHPVDGSEAETELSVKGMWHVIGAL